MTTLSISRAKESNITGIFDVHNNVETAQKSSHSHFHYISYNVIIFWLDMDERNNIIMNIRWTSLALIAISISNVRDFNATAILQKYLRKEYSAKRNSFQYRKKYTKYMNRVWLDQQMTFKKCHLSIRILQNIHVAWKSLKNECAIIEVSQLEPWIQIYNLYIVGFQLFTLRKRGPSISI